MQNLRTPLTLKLDSRLRVREPYYWGYTQKLRLLFEKVSPAAAYNYLWYNGPQNPVLIIKAPLPNPYNSPIVSLKGLR